MFASALFTVALLPGFGTGADATQRTYEALAEQMAAAGAPLDGSAPVIIDYPIWLAETARVPTLALPDESPADVLDLAAHFGARWLIVVSPNPAGWPSVLDGTDPGAQCFQEIPLPLPADPVRGGCSRGRARVPHRVRRHRACGRQFHGDSCREWRPMTPGTDTLPTMDGSKGEQGDTRFDELRAQATDALSYSANTLRAVRDRYRAAFMADLTRWQALDDDLTLLERGPEGDAVVKGESDAPDASDARSIEELAATAAEAGAADIRLRMVRLEVEHSRGDLGRREGELSRLELAIRHLESTWLFLERGDASLVTDGSPGTETDVQMRIVEAQEAERARIAQEVHDGPAQALSNAIFQVEFIERVFDSDRPLARTELRFLRELLRRELGEVRTFIGQLRPPVLDALGLDGSIAETVTTQAALSGLPIETELDAPSDGIRDAARTVVLRVIQEALQNVRKHAGATKVVVATAVDGGQWVLEVRDDGRGFDVGAVAARGRRNFGLQFMRERAELVGAQFEVRSRPGAGTIVRLAIPLTRKENG